MAGAARTARAAIGGTHRVRLDMGDQRHVGRDLGARHVNVDKELQERRVENVLEDAPRALQVVENTQCPKGARLQGSHTHSVSEHMGTSGNGRRRDAGNEKLSETAGNE